MYIHKKKNTHTHTQHTHTHTHTHVQGGKMLLADAEHDDTIAVNVTQVQQKSKALLAGLLIQVTLLCID